jgi:hypothetical protein
MELKRTGASSTASVRTIPVTPAFTVETVVEPGYGRTRAWPPNSNTAARSDSRCRSACTTAV